MTVEEYLAFERAGDTKHEYFDGQAFAMAGASYAHFVICGNLITKLNSRLSGGPCRAGGSDLRIKVKSQQFYTYPDVVVVCGKPHLEDAGSDTLLNPKAIIEVLSPSTERFDRGKKFALYQALDSLTDYVLVSQEGPRVEHYEREDAGHWRLAVYDATEDVVGLRSISCDLPLNEIYEGVEFGPSQALR